MPERPVEISPWGIRGMYLLAGILVLWPLADLVTNTWPMQFGNFRWRYGFAGLLGGFHLTPLFGYVLAMYVAIWRGQPRVLKTIGVVGFVGALALVIVMVIFPLDTIQIRASRPPEQLTPLMVGAVIAEAKHFTTFLVLSMLGAGAWTTGKRMAEGTESDRGARPGVVVRPEPR